MEISIDFSEITAVIAAATALVAVVVGPFVTWRITQHQEQRADERAKLQMRQQRAEKFESNSARLVDLVGQFISLSGVLAKYVNDEDPAKREKALNKAKGELTLIHREISAANSQLLLLCDPNIEVERRFLDALTGVAVSTLESTKNLVAGTPNIDNEALSKLLEDFMDKSRQVSSGWVD